MTGARWRVLGVLGAAAIAAAVFGLAAIRPERTEPPSESRPKLLLLTSLPLLFNEDFSLQGGGSPALKALQSHYRVMPISVADGAELAKGQLLLMAQPPVQTAENLVVLDEWVRRGGRVLLLADPLLEWPSKRPFGDPLRPPPMFMDTGLLGHWGVTLDAPDKRGHGQRKLGGYDVETVSPGSLSGHCEISSDRLVAICRIGKGRATIIADGDLLDVDQLGEGADHNLDGVIAELSRLDSP
jgi:hypothetical protein